MDRRRFLLASAALPLVPCSGDAVKASPQETVAPSSLSESPMMARYRLTRDRVLHGSGPMYSPEFLLEDIRATPGRRFTNFSGDVSGRWIGALSVASATYGETFPVLAQVVRGVVALQHPEGYFGKTFHFDHPDDDDLALLWGNGRLLVGLMEYYALTHDPAVLESARKLGNFLVRLGPPFNSAAMAEAFGAAHFASSYICWTQQTEGLTALYAVTKDPRYRDLCAAIAERIQRRPADHVHGYLCSLRGTIALYNVDGQASLLQQVEAGWRDVMDSGDVLITGGVPEAWSPLKKRTEGCAECDWLRLNLALWQATAKPVYLEMTERILFNEFAMNQFDTGDFGHARLDEFGAPETVYVRAWWCCTLHGLRAFPDVQQSVFRQRGKTVFYDLPVDGAVESEGFAARATSRLGQDGTIRIAVAKSSGEKALTIRQPAWAGELQIARNGKNVSGTEIQGLRAGDVVTVKYGMGLAVSAAGNSQELAKRKKFTYGPWLLGVPSGPNPGYFNELYAENVLQAKGTRPAAQQGSSTPFAVPLAATTISCVMKEFPNQPQTVQLRAVAEQTGSAPMQWATAFRAEEGRPA